MKKLDTGITITSKIKNGKEVFKVTYNVEEVYNEPINNN